MAIQKITFDAASVSSKMDADINHFLTSGVNGIFYGILGRCQASVSNNYISFQNGYVQVYGRRIYVESGTKISVSLDGSAYGYVIIKIDLGNNAISLEKKEASSAYPTLTQDDLMNGGLIYEFPLCRYTKTSTSITLDTNYDPPLIKNDETKINEKGQSVKSDMSSLYGYVYDGWSHLSYGHCYVFDGITSSNAYNGIISVYVGGTNVIFCGASVGGSGGIVHYRYNGQDCTLSCQLTSSKLYVEDSRGNEPKYARVIKNTELNRSFSDLKECWRIRAKLLKTNERLTIEEIGFIKKEADGGSPLAEFIYGLYYFLNESNQEEAEVWWSKFFYHSNGDALWVASGIFASLGDEFYDWSMKCLKRAAWRQHPIAKRMYKTMKENPYKFPEA